MPPAQFTQELARRQITEADMKEGLRRELLVQKLLNQEVTAKATVIEPPTRNQGARRVWSDSQGRIWVAEWNSGNLSRYDPQDRSWNMYKPPVVNPHTYSVYVDDRDRVWITEWTHNAIMRFDADAQQILLL